MCSSTETGSSRSDRETTSARSLCSRTSRARRPSWRARRSGRSGWMRTGSIEWLPSPCGATGRTGRRTATWNTDPGGTMDCWHCRRTAVGSCRFCGRGVCEDHAQTQPFVLDLYRTSEVVRALVVEDALFCGACTPRPDPIDLPELDE